MDEKNMRMNMIKIFVMGMKYANAGIIDDDFFYSNICLIMEMNRQQSNKL